MNKIRLIETVSKGSHARKTVDPQLILGDISKGFEQGTILDANAIVELIIDLFKNGTVMESSITSAQISDGSVTEDDLSEELVNKINSASGVTYNATTESAEFTSNN